MLARKGRERSWLIQDDGGTLYRDGRFRGFEAGGLFIKTDCLNPGDQIEAYYACLRKDTFLENVCRQRRRQHRLLRPAAHQQRPRGRRTPRLHAHRQRHQRPADRQPVPHHPRQHHPRRRQADARAGGGLHGARAVDGVVGRRSHPGRHDQERVLLRPVHRRRPLATTPTCSTTSSAQNPQINCYLLNTGWVGEGAFVQGHHAWPTRWASSTRCSAAGPTNGTFREATGLVIPRSIRAVDSILMQPEKLFPAGRLRVPPAAPRPPAGGVHGQLPRTRSRHQGRVSGQGGRTRGLSTPVEDLAFRFRPGRMSVAKAPFFFFRALSYGAAIMELDNLKIAWSPGLSVGNYRIDEQHRISSTPSTSCCRRWTTRRPTRKSSPKRSPA